MNTRLIAKTCLVVACCLPAVQAQDNGIGPVDFSVHSDVDGQAQPPEPSRSSAKRSTSFSNWSPQPVAPGTSALAWPALVPAYASEHGAQPPPGRSRPVVSTSHTTGTSSTSGFTREDPASLVPSPVELHKMASPFSKEQSHLARNPFNNNFSRAERTRKKRFKPRRAGSGQEDKLSRSARIQ
jgi:hypothetical protein